MDRDDAQEGGEGKSAMQKPVSSLRSQFEMMTTPKSKITAPASPHTRQSSQVLDVPKPISTQSTPRQSLDVPYRPHQRTQSETTDKRIPPEPPKPRRSRPNTPPQKLRPASILPSGPPQASPPRLDVTSPKSPPKHIDLSSAIPLNFAGSSTNRSAPPSPRLSPSASGHFRIPSRSISPDGVNASILQPQSPRIEAGGFAIPSITKKTDNNPALANKQTTKPSMGPPPPVNRAAKARVLSTELSTTLKPAAPVKQARSPFSTPPGSADVTPALGTDGSSPVERRLATPTGRSPPRSHLDRPPTHYAVAERQRRGSSKERGLGLGLNGASHFQRRQDDDTEVARPELPPRREQASSRTSAEIPARTSTDISRPSALSLGFASRSTAVNPRVPSTALVAPPSPRQASSGSARAEGRSSSRQQTQVPALPARSQTVKTSASEFSLPSRLNGLRRDDAHESYQVALDTSKEYPDPSQANRRPPYFKDTPKAISTTYDLRLIDVCGEFVCCAGPATRVWSLLTGKMILSMTHGEGVRVTSVCFKPAKRVEDEGNILWLGTNWGEILEIDISTRKTIATNPHAHARREILRIYRNAAELWTLDDEGKLYVWPGDESGAPNLIYGIAQPRLPRGHTASLAINKHLWLATGKEIRVFQPNSVAEQATEVTEQPLIQQDIGEVSSATTFSSQPELIYFGHSDGKISIYSRETFTCQGVFNVSTYKVNSLSGVGRYLWAGYSSGNMFVYDTSSSPWKVKKEWKGHSMPVVSMIADRSSIWTLGRLQVVSLGLDNTVKVWDGLLEQDWLDNEMHEHDMEFCTFKDMTSLVMTWNAGASKPADLRYDEQNSNFFREMLQAQEPPDVIVFGLQELVDLEDKRLTAKSFFKGKNKDAYGNEQLSSAYRTWRDHFSRCIEEYMPRGEPYFLLHSASLVGLFICVFAKSTHRQKIKEVQAAEVKTGLGGLHGNKGAIIVRFILDDSSVCFVNCHLAAGQKEVMNRNHDITTILESTNLPVPHVATSQPESFAHGGDGSMIMDHEICIVNGDLNYRIDGLSRDAVVDAIESGNLSKLLEHDQLLQTRQRNAGFVLRAFKEGKLTFNPTYKYDAGTDRYDTSEKRRAPAWCDRILYRGSGNKVRQTEYRRHELKVSDHRPVSGRFVMRVKTIRPDKRLEVRRRCEHEFQRVKAQMVHEAMLDYQVGVHGLTIAEARKQLQNA